MSLPIYLKRLCNNWNSDQTVLTSLSQYIAKSISLNGAKKSQANNQKKFTVHRKRSQHTHWRNTTNHARAKKTGRIQRDALKFIPLLLIDTRGTR